MDWITVLIFLLLVVIGWVSVYSAVYNEEHYSIFDLSQRYGKQLVWIILALILALICMIVESRVYSIFGYVIYGATIFMLILVLLVGKEIKGAHSWFAVGSFMVQPSEFAKFATSLAIARFLSSYNLRIKNTKSLQKALIIIGVPAILIILQGDTGSALIYGAFILVLYREGMWWGVLALGAFFTLLFVNALIFELYATVLILFFLSLMVYTGLRRQLKESGIAAAIYLGTIAILWAINDMMGLGISLFILFFIGFVAVAIPALIWAFRYKLSYLYMIIVVFISSVTFTYSVDYVFNNVLEQHHRTRINVLLGIDEDIQGPGYNVHQSKIAIGSGGIVGKGFLQGTQTKYNFVPEQSTDFIFCTIGEEWGFIGTSTVIFLYVFMLMRLIWLAERQRSNFSRIFGYSVASIMFFHVAINLGMTMGLAPVIGIPLPFISYGGSSLWAFTILLFIFIRLDASRLELL